MRTVKRTLPDEHLGGCKVTSLERFRHTVMGNTNIQNAVVAILRVFLVSGSFIQVQS